MAPPAIDLRTLPPDPTVDPEAHYRQKDPHYLRHLLESVAPDPLVVVDADTDGYVDSRWLTALSDIRRGFSLQNELYRIGAISSVRPPEAPPSAPVSTPVFDYLDAETLKTGEVRLFAYFDDPAELATFKRQVGRPDLPLQIIPAERVERRPGMARDVVDPDLALPERFAEQIDDINRPIAGNSRTGRYFRVDVTQILGLSPRITSRLGQRGSQNSNCANLVLVASGLEDRFEFVEPDTFVTRLRDPGQFKPVTQEGRGDVVVWYRKTDAGRDFLHAFIDLGNGWALTKNGSTEDNPLRLQRIETLRYLYDQQANRAQITVAYYVPKWVINPDHYGWQRDGGGEPPPYRPMIEEHYRPVP